MAAILFCSHFYFFWINQDYSVAAEPLPKNQSAAPTTVIAIIIIQATASPQRYIQNNTLGTLSKKLRTMAKMPRIAIVEPILLIIVCKALS